MSALVVMQGANSASELGVARRSAVVALLVHIVLPCRASAPLLSNLSMSQMTPCPQWEGGVRVLVCKCVGGQVFKCGHLGVCADLMQ